MEYEQRQLDRMAAIEEASRDIIGVSKSIFDIVNDWNEAQILAELYYWTSAGKTGRTKLRIVKDGYKWLACSREEWWGRRRLTIREVDRAIIRLIKKDLVIKQVFLFNGLTTLHLRLNIAEFMDKYSNIARKTYLDDESLLEGDTELFDAEALMGWDKFDEEITKKVTPSYQKGNSINSNVHSKLPINENDELEQFQQFQKDKKLSQKQLSNATKQVHDMVEHSKKAEKNKHQELPEQLIPLAKLFMDKTGIAYLPSQRTFWASSLQEWQTIGVTAEDIELAVDRMGGYVINSPKSLTTILNGLVAERKRDVDNDPRSKYTLVTED
jgi:hypothetical protein